MSEKRDLLRSEWEFSKTTSYFILALSIVAEQVGTACLEASRGYTVLLFSVLAIVLYFVTYFLFGKILSRIDLAVAYATWSAVGSVGASLMGVLIFSQSMSVIGWISIAGMVVGVFLLNCFGTPRESGGASQEVMR